MRRFLLAALLVCMALRAHAEPVSGTGPEVVWLTPRDASEVDLASGDTLPIAFTSSRRLSEKTWLRVRLLPGEVAWIRLDASSKRDDVRFARLATDDNAGMLTELTPFERGPSDFLVQAPFGPPMELGLQARSARALPRAQIWIAAANRPDYRWEMWEELAKAWAHAPEVPPPSPPDEAARDLVDSLLTVADAFARARREDGITRSPGEAAVLTAEALLRASPAREPIFPYARRIDLTRAIARSAGLRHSLSHGVEVVEVNPGKPVTFHVSGPGILRIDARAAFPSESRRRYRPFSLVLRSGTRVIELETAPAMTGAARSEDGEGVASLRRLVAPAPPGDHEYVFEVRGGPAQVSLFQHYRANHVEDAITGSEDFATLLGRGATDGSGSGLLHDLLTAEAAFMDLRSTQARGAFERVDARAREPVLKAFALGRLVALAKDVSAAKGYAEEALELLSGQDTGQSARLRDLIALEFATRALADGDAPAAQAMAARVPSMLQRFPKWAGSVLRGQAKGPSDFLAVFPAALREHPLDAPLLRAASREWWAGSRWAETPMEASHQARTEHRLVALGTAKQCAEAEDRGSTFVALPGEEQVSLRVSPSDAPPPYLRRFHLLALPRDTSQVLGRLELRVDDAETTLPVLPGLERIPVALDQGEHRLSARYDRGQVLVPCSLLQDPTLHAQAGAVYAERRLVSLAGAGAQTRATLPEANGPHHVLVEVYPAPGHAQSALRVRAGGTELARIEVHAHPRGAKTGPDSGLGLALEVPAGTRTLELIRVDDGLPLPVRVLVRKSQAPAPRIARIAPRAPAHELTVDEARALQVATAGVRTSVEPVQRALRRLARAELLLAAGMQARARTDLERALPLLADTDAERARGLLEATAMPTLLRALDGRHAVVLAGGAGMVPEPEGRACVDRILQSLDTSSDANERLTACPGALGAYVAARHEDAAGHVELAGALYAQAHARAGQASLAREAALRLADVPTARQQALALANTALNAGDPDAERALQHMRHGLTFKPLTTVEGGETMSLPAVVHEADPARLALLDLPWPHEDAIPVRAGHALQSTFRVDAPLALLVEAFCEFNGAAPDEPERCPLTLTVDGIASAQELPSGRVTGVSEQALSQGEHRVSVQVERHARDAQVFVRMSTSRPLAGEPAGPDGRYVLGRAAMLRRRVLTQADHPVQVPLSGPTTVRLDALITAAPGGERALELSIHHADGRVEHRHQPVCVTQKERLTPPVAERFDCHATVLLPLTEPGAAELSVAPSAGTEAALAFAISDFQPTEPEPISVTTIAVLPDTGPTATEPTPSIFRTLEPPRGNLKDMLGTLQVQMLEVYGSKASADPRVGDRFQEVSVLYRRKLDHLPIWLLGAGFLRLRDGPASQGGQLLTFTRIPPIQLRWLTDLQVFSQPYEHARHNSIAFESYLERTFQTFPRFYLLPRVGLTSVHQSLSAVPALRVSGNPALDPSVWNTFDRLHPFSTYGQLLLWWVPHVNLIAYGAGRITSSSTVRELDRYTLKAGIHLVLGTTEINGTYVYAHEFAGQIRPADFMRQQLGGELDHTLWLTRGQRLGFRAAGAFNPAQASYLVFGGMFWEGSFSRGLDDYSPRDVNFPQQLARGRGIPGQEFILR